MVRFYFHLYDDVVSMDEEGAELPDLESALERAIRSARAIAAEEVIRGKLDLRHRIEVTDGSGGKLFTVRFEDAVEVES